MWSLCGLGKLSKMFSCYRIRCSCGDCYPFKKGRCLNQSHLICTPQSEHTNPTDDPSRVRDHVVGHDSDIDIPTSSLNDHSLSTISFHRTFCQVTKVVPSPIFNGDSLMLPLP